jgi:2',3'-cyclic-nucleotide 2'-phosphodiesterase/3'-nucleotidase/5'-nucleotidase
MILISALTVAAMALQTEQLPAAQDSAHIVLVATTDLHGHATDWDYARDQPFPGGLSRVATIVDSLKALYPGGVVVLDAGDLLQGDAFATYFARIRPRDPHPLIEAMNLTGYDVATPGNHEFDGGLDSMRQAIRGASFPYVSGNIYTLRGDTLLYPAYVVLRRQGIRIGVTGFTTPGAMVWDREQLKGKVRIDRIPAAAARVLAAMRRESDVAVALVHSGMEGPSSYDSTGVGGEHAAATLAALLVRPDVVVVGHSHREMRDSVIGGVHFVQPRPFGASVSVTHLDLVKQADRWRLLRVRAELVSAARASPSYRVAQRLRPAHAAVLSWIQTPLGRALGPMGSLAARAEPTPILNFINAVQRARTGADLSAASAFALDAGFERGLITMGQVVALYPFDNTLRAVRITGEQLKAYLEHSARFFKADAVGRISLNDSVPGYNFDVVAGARYDIDLRRPVGDRIQNLSVRGRPVRAEDSFTLALNSYRQTGGGGYSMLRNAPVVYDKDENIRDLLVEELRRLGEIDPANYEAREWRIVPEGSAAAVRNLFKVPAQPLALEAQDTIQLRVLATADLHGRIQAGSSGTGPAGGLAAVAGVMDSLARECGCPTLRLDAGDALQGTLLSNVSRGRAMVEALNSLNFSAAVPGEHDFDWSVDTLRRRISESSYPWLAANVFDSATGRRPDWLAPYRMLQAGKLKVAVVGYLTPETKTALKPELTAGLRLGEGVFAIHDILAEVRAQRPDITILLAHAGASCQGSVCTGEAISLVEGLEARSIDLLLGGHSHNIANARVAGVAIVEPGMGGEAVAVADLVKTAAGGREVRTRTVSVRPDSVTPSAQVAAVVERSVRRADSLTGRVVATIKLPLTRVGDQYRLGSLIAESRRNALRADVGLVSNDAIKADLPAGRVTYGQLHQVLPSQLRLVRVTLTGAQLRELLERTIDREGHPTGHVAGVTVRYEPGAGKDRVRSVQLPGGRALRSKESYTLATDEVLAGGGNGYSMLASLSAEPGGVLDVEALIMYLRRLPQPVAVESKSGFTSNRR